MTNLTTIRNAGNGAGQNTISSGGSLSDVTSGWGIFVSVIIASKTVNVSSISDEAGNTYVKASRAAHNGSSYGAEIWHCAASVGLVAGQRITVYLSGAALAELIAQSFDNAVTLSDSGAATGSSATPSASTGAAVASASLLFGVVIADGSATMTNGAGWTSDYSTNDFASLGTLSARASHVLVTVGAGVATFNPTLNKSANWACVIAAYGAGAASVPSASGWGGLLY